MWLHRCITTYWALRQRLLPRGCALRIHLEWRHCAFPQVYDKCMLNGIFFEGLRKSIDTSCGHFGAAKKLSRMRDGVWIAPIMDPTNSTDWVAPLMDTRDNEQEAHKQSAVSEFKGINQCDTLCNGQLMATHIDELDEIGAVYNAGNGTSRGSEQNLLLNSVSTSTIDHNLYRRFCLQQKHRSKACDSGWHATEDHQRTKWESKASPIRPSRVETLYKSNNFHPSPPRTPPRAAW